MGTPYMAAPLCRNKWEHKCWSVSLILTRNGVVHLMCLDIMLLLVRQKFFLLQEAFVRDIKKSLLFSYMSVK